MSNAALDQGIATLQDGARGPPDHPPASRPRAPVTTSAPSAPIGTGARADGSGPAGRRRGWRAPVGASTTARRAWLRFGVPALIALALVAAGAGLAVRDRGSGQAAREAGRMARAVGLGMIQPRLTDAVLAGEPHAVAGLDAFVRRRVLSLDAAIDHLALVNADERIVYSGQARGGGAHGGRLQIDVPVRTATGRRGVVRLSLRAGSVSAETREVWTTFAPVLFAALVALWLLQLPLAWLLTRRVQGARRDRERLLEAAMAASESDRRRIAGDLHDGVVQDLAGLSLTLAAGARRAGEPEIATTMGEAADRTRQSIRELRALLIDIHPAKLQRAGLQSALQDHVAPLAMRGLRTRTAVDADLAARPEVEQLVFRTAREALRNVLLHAHAGEVALEATAHDGGVQLAVQDDGRDVGPEAAARTGDTAPTALQLLADRAAELGGRLATESACGGGTRVVLELPGG